FLPLLPPLEAEGGPELLPSTPRLFGLIGADAGQSPQLGRRRGRHDRTGEPTVVRPGCGRETASLPAAAGCAAAPRATRRAAVRAAAATASRGGPCAPCRARRAAACARNRYRRP